MPVIRTRYGWGLVGLGETPATTTNQQVVTPGYTDGLSLWKSMSSIGAGFSNLGAMFTASPLAALGFLTPVLAGAALLLGGGFGGGYYRARKRYRGGGATAPNPRRRRRKTAGKRRRNPGGPTKRVVGTNLSPDMKRAVLNAYGYRWTVENEQRARQWFARGGHKPPTAPLVTDSQWLAQHAFSVTTKGTLSRRDKWAAPHYLANPRSKRRRKRNPARGRRRLRATRQYIVLWDNEHASGSLPGTYPSYSSAAKAGAAWKREMVAIEPTAADRAEARRVYQWEVVEKG